MKSLSDTRSHLTDDRLAEIVRRLVAAFSPRAIYLFGSQVSGLACRDSDVDVMVVLEEAPPQANLFQLGYAALRGLGLPVELHFATRARFERFADVFGSLPNEIRRKGVLLYAPET